jgi:hypothetical protein
MPAPSASPEFEVLPPEGKGGGLKPQDAVVRLIAHFMDSLMTIPGTKARIGLNPFLDLVPVFGDGAAVVLNAFAIIEGLRRGVPKIVLTRMGLNVLLNGVLGTIPGVGEVFAFWYKPTSRNYALLEKHSLPPGSVARPAAAWHEWAFVFGLIGLLLVTVGILVGAGIYISFLLFHWLSRALG